MKLYIVCAVWANTKNNHAGMYYLGKRIQEDAPSDINVKLIPIYVRGSFYLKPFYSIINFFISIYLKYNVSKNDIVFLMEYLLPVCEQGNIAKRLKKKAKIISIAHLIPRRIEDIYTNRRLKEMISHVDYLLVLGSSLKKYLIEKKTDERKIIKTFHYVDTNFYFPRERKSENILNIICMGNMERNYNELEKIIKSLPQMHFHICMGILKPPSFLRKHLNVTLYGFLKEAELLEIMQKCDISLNIMNDTVGSNVITTSLASGLAIIASNVGSISDYVTNGKEGYLINSQDEAIKYLEFLNMNRSIINQMQLNSVYKSKEYSIDNFEDMFYKLIRKI